MRVVYLGMGGPFSSIPLRQLLENRVEVCAVAVPASGPEAAGAMRLPVTQPSGHDSVADMALRSGIPVASLRHGDPQDMQRLLGGYAPDAVMVACFPWRLPSEMLTLPRYGCFNLHPSLLPAYRGPAPLFWQFFHDEHETGVTLHRMTLDIDAGDVAAQRQVPLFDGVSGPAAEALLAEEGGQLMLETLACIAAGSLVLTPQGKAGHSQHHWPNEGDFRLSSHWSARRAFNFIRGTRHWGNPYVLEVAGTPFLVEDAVAYDEQAELGQAYWLVGSRLSVQCAPGVLIARTTDSM